MSLILLVVASFSVRAVMAERFIALQQQAGTLFYGNEPSHIAAHLAKGEGFSSPYPWTPVSPTAQQPPLYPFLIAVIFKVFGVLSLKSLQVIVWLNAVAGTAASLLIYWVGRRYVSANVGLLAAWIWALSPAIAATDVFMSNYAIATLLVLLWLLVVPELPASRKAWMLLGLAAGLAMLLNSMLVILYPASYGWLIRKKRCAVLALITTVLVMALWMGRNYFALGHAYPMLRDNFGLELYIGNHPEINDKQPVCAWRLCAGTYSYVNVYDGLAELGEARFFQKRARDAMAYIRARPGKFLQRSAKRFAAFWLLPYPWFYLPVTILAWMEATQTPGPLGFFLMVMFGVYPLAFYVTQIAWVTSYRHPIEPLLLVSAVAFLRRYAAGVGRFRSRAGAASPA
ncbi:MAG TPA: glycosyltransferase family 39 protein [Terriglobales bacterium]|nr:glycosyltransferase family 39 protein [Terriglobales bacterium]